MIQKVILDTTIYGFIANDKKLSPQEIEELQLKIKADDSFKIFGINVIRREIKNTYRSNKEMVRTLLRIYDFLKDKEYSVDSQIKDMAEKYYDYYQKLNGKKPYKELETDLLIVATATIKQTDIVVSGDRETMSMSSKYGGKFRKAYHNVNVVEGYRDPTFWQYKDLKLKFGFFKIQL